MGETLAYLIERLDHQIATKARGYRLPLLSGGYWWRNVYCSTSGCHSPDAFRMLWSRTSLNRIVLGSDYPYDSTADTTDFLCRLPLEDRERARIACWNAVEMGIWPA